MRALRVGVLLATLVGLIVGIPNGAEAKSPAVFEYPLERDSLPYTIVDGPDGRIWSTDLADPANVAPRLIATSNAGEISIYPMPDRTYGIAVGPDGNLWVTGQSPVVYKVTTAGQVSATYPLPDDGSGAFAISIAAGPDGNLWYSRLNGKVGRLTTAGVPTEFPIPPPAGGLPAGASDNPEAIVAGPLSSTWVVDNIWDSTFENVLASRVVRVESSGNMTAFPLPAGTWAIDIAAGPDGNLWVTDHAQSRVIRMTPTGSTTQFPVPGSDPWLFGIDAGPDGNLWAGGSHLWRITPTGTITPYPLGEFKFALGLDFGHDGKLWFAQAGDAPSIGKFTISNSPVGEFTSLTPARILDTRDGTGRGGVVGKLGQQQQFSVQITGQGGVPQNGVSAVVLNATVTEPTGDSYLTVWPSGLSRPVLSNLNYVAGDTAPNLVTVGVGANGLVDVYNNVGATHVIFDVVGYYATSTGTEGARYKPLNPARYFDTRDGTGGVPARPVSGGTALPFDVTGHHGVPDTGVTGVVMNVTVTEPTASGHVTVYPGDVSRPLASNLNFSPGVTRPNLVTVRVPSNGIVNFYNSQGHTHLLADVVGYYTTDVTTNEGRFVPIAPERLFDSRIMAPGKMPPLGVLGLPVGGATAVPPGDVDGAVMNVTVTEPTANGFITVFPGDDCTIPFASNLNFVPGQTVPNLVISRLSNADVEGCSIREGVDIFNRAGQTHVIVDVFGYFTDAHYSDYSIPSPVDLSQPTLTAASADRSGIGQTMTGLDLPED
jgi:streptogramin lyase